MSIEQKTMTATFIKQVNGKGDGRVYRVSPSILYGGDYTADYTEKVNQQSTDYVWVSATVVPYSGPETYIFASTVDGDVLDWGELPGSFRGGLDHESALRGAGYTVSE